MVVLFFDWRWRRSKYRLHRKIKHKERPATQYRKGKKTRERWEGVVKIRK